MTRDDIIRLYEKANGWSPAVWPNTVEDLTRFAALVAAAEREACALVCEEYESDMGYGQPQKCADAIRARGETK